MNYAHDRILLLCAKYYYILYCIMRLQIFVFSENSRIIIRITVTAHLTRRPANNNTEILFFRNQNKSKKYSSRIPTITATRSLNFLLIHSFISIVYTAILSVVRKTFVNFSFFFLICR